MDNNREQLLEKLEEDFRVHAEIESFFKSQRIKSFQDLVEIAESRGAYSDGFTDRLIEVESKLRDRFFGLTYEIVSTKMLRRDRSAEALMEALACGEKYFSDKEVINEQIDWRGFLKSVLETDAPLFNYEEYLFGSVGVKRDRSGLTEPQKEAIAFQAGGQVLWHLEKNKIPTIEKMKELLLDKTNLFWELFDLKESSSCPIPRGWNPRTIENWVREIFPVPADLRKGRPSKKGIASSLFDNLVLIPEIFFENEAKINFLKLRFALACLTRVLKALGWSLEKIIESHFIKLYIRPLGFEFFVFSKSIIENWIREAFTKKGSIFT